MKSNKNIGELMTAILFAVVLMLAMVLSASAQIGGFSRDLGSVTLAQNEAEQEGRGVQTIGSYEALTGLAEVPSTGIPLVREIPIATGPGDQMFPRMVSDGAGGAVITWFDTRSGDADIFAQWVSAGGHVLWDDNGVPVSEAPGDQLYPKILRDDTEVIIVWEDERCKGNKDVSAQRLRLSREEGEELRIWVEDGVPLISHCYPGNQLYPQIASDGAGGAIIVWSDGRNGNLDVYSQRVDAGGSVVWTRDGMPVVKAPGDQAEPQIATDGLGGAFITFEDYREDPGSVHVQRINPKGLPMCGPDGVPVVKGTLVSHTQTASPSLTAQKIYAIWHDGRNDEGDIYGQKVGSCCNSLWTKGGIPIVTAPGDQDWFRIVSDGVGGAIIIWWDSREGNDDIYAQRISAEGNILWAAGGVPISTGQSSAIDRPEWQINRPRIASEVAGDPIIVWWDSREGDDDIYAQRISTEGVPLWPTNGVPVCRAPGPQRYPQVLSDEAGGAIVVWEDERNGDVDLYAAIISSLDPWAEINAELNELIEKVNNATMPNIIKRRLIDKLEYAKTLKENAKIAHEAGNNAAAEKYLGVAKSQVESFASMVEITRRISEADKKEFLRESAKIIEKIEELIESL